MTFDDLGLLFRNSSAIKLLRARNAPMILSFFHNEFGATYGRTVSNSDLKTRLSAFLDEIDFADNDEEISSETLFDDTHRKAHLYIERWSNEGFIRKYPDENGEDHHELTADTIKVFNWLDLLAKKEFIGTNGRFRDIFFKLQQLIELTTEDPEKRITELEKRKHEIQLQIDRIILEQRVNIADDTDIKERFHEISRAARELTSDFAQVEQNFQGVRKELQRKYAEKDSVKGILLIEALNSLDSIYEQDEGKSFKAFWQFLTDSQRQTEFKDLVIKLYGLLDEKGIEYNNDKFLKNLKRLLHASGKKVIDANKKLSERINRVLSEKNLLERKKAISLIGEIRGSARALIDREIDEDAFIIIETEPSIDLPERWTPYQYKEDNPVFVFPDVSVFNEDVNFASLFDQFTIDKKQLVERIDIMLQRKQTVTLKELVNEYGIEKGLSELIGYFSIACEDTAHCIMDATDPILIRDRKINMPMIIFTKKTI